MFLIVALLIGRRRLVAALARVRDSRVLERGYISTEPSVTGIPEYTEPNEGLAGAGAPGICRKVVMCKNGNTTTLVYDSKY